MVKFGHATWKDSWTMTYGGGVAVFPPEVTKLHYIRMTWITISRGTSNRMTMEVPDLIKVQHTYTLIGLLVYNMEIVLDA